MINIYLPLINGQARTGDTVSLGHFLVAKESNLLIAAAKQLQNKLYLMTDQPDSQNIGEYEWCDQ